MKVAVASMGTVPDAWVGVHAGRCSQFPVFDLDAPPHPEQPERVSLATLRALIAQDVATVITGQILDGCRTTLQTPGIKVLDGVEGLTVGEAIERYRASGLKTPTERKGATLRVAVAAHNGGLDAPLEQQFGVCASFVVVDPQMMEWEWYR